MNSLDNRENYYTYFGSIDDFLIKYWRKGINFGFLRELFARELLIGGKIIINDGHLLLVKPLLESLLKSNKTPLKQLIEKGWIKIFSRTSGNLHEIPEKMISKGVLSYIKPAVDFVNNDSLSDYLKDLSSEFKKSNAFINWPGQDLGIGLFELIRCSKDEFIRIENIKKNKGVVDDVFKKFEDQFLKNSNAPRTLWEDIIISDKSIPKTIKKKLMIYSNIAHHLNVGSFVVLSDSSLKLKVESNSSDLFTNLRQRRVDIQENIKPLPLIECPSIIDIKDSNRLSDLLDEEDFFKFKTDYLIAKDKYIKGQDSYSLERLRHYTNSYSLYLQDYFGNKKNSTLKKIGYAMAVLIPGITSTTIAYPLKLTWGVISSSVATLLTYGFEKYLYPVISRKYNLIRRKAIKTNDLFDQTFSEHIELNKNKVKNFYKDIPEFK